MQIKENNAHNFHIKNILKKLEEKEQDAMLVANFNNIYYLSGYLSTSFAFLIIKENPIIFVSGMDLENARNTSSIDIVKYESYDKMIEYLKEEGIRNLAMESDLAASVYEKFKDFNLSFSNAISAERMIKTDEEIKKIVKATDIAHKSLIELDVRSKQEKGALEWECAYELGYLMRKNGASVESFDTIFASGSVSSLPHSTPRQYQLETPVARDIIAEYGYGDNFIHSTGHSLGLDIHESPSVSLRDQTILENNMIVTIEPGIYLEGEFGIRIEDMVLVDKKGKIVGNLPQIL